MPPFLPLIVPQVISLLADILKCEWIKVFMHPASSAVNISQTEENTQQQEAVQCH